MAPRFRFSPVPGLVAATTFAVSDVLAKLVLVLGCDVLTMLSLRSVFGVAFGAVWLRVGPKPKGDARVRWLAMVNGLLFGGVIACLFMAFQAIDVPTAILAYFIYPLLTGLTASLMGLEPVRWRGILCALVAFFGLAVMIGAHPAGLALAGVAYALGAACFRTGVLIFSRAFLSGADARLTAYYTQLSSALMFVAVSLATWNWNGPQTIGGWTALIGLGLTTTAGVLYIFVSTVRIGPFRTALIMYLEPLIATILSAFVLGEVITPLQGAGGAIMLVALVAFQLWR